MSDVNETKLYDGVPSEIADGARFVISGEVIIIMVYGFVVGMGKEGIMKICQSAF